MPEGSLRARLAHGTIWTLLGSLVSQGSGVLGSIISARILGSVGFGELGMIRSTVLMFAVLAGNGLGMAATKYVAEFRVLDPQKTGRIVGLLLNTTFILGGGVTLLCFTLAVPLASGVMKAPHLAEALQVGCLMLLLTTLNGVQSGVVCGFEAFRTQAHLCALDGISNLLLIPAGALFYGVTGAMGGSVIAALLGVIVKQRAMSTACKYASITIKHRDVFSEISALWKFVLPSVLVGLSIQPFEWLARLMLARQPNGYAELGVFTAAFTWAQIIYFLPNQVSGPMLPILSNLIALRQFEKLKKAIVSSQVIIFAIAVATAIPLAFFAPYILRAYGTEFVSGTLTLLVMIGAYVICVVALITRAFFAAASCMWLQAFHTLIWGVVLVAGCKFLIHSGSLGLAMAYCISYVFLTGLQLSTQYIVMGKLQRTN